MDWLMETRPWEWFFSGLGVVMAVGLARWLWRGRQRTAAPTDLPAEKAEKPPRAGDAISVNAGGDAVVAKDNARAVNVKASQVGVVGDHADIKGGIQFTTNRKPGSGDKP